MTSSISVVTGRTSLITVPAMFQFHIDPRIAIATNMFALTFMSIGGTLPFLKRQDVNRKRVPALIALTLFGSLVGAFMLLLIPPRAVSAIVSASVIAIAILALIYRKFGVESHQILPSVRAEFAGYALTFVLG
ncbi:MAG: sulfite exporter TauE/SafE family protein, partial [Alloacidobacterium sp.]